VLSEGILRGWTEDLNPAGLLFAGPPGRPLFFRKRGTEALGVLFSQERDLGLAEGEMAKEVGDRGKGAGWDREASIRLRLDEGKRELPGDKRDGRSRLPPGCGLKDNELRLF